MYLGTFDVGFVISFGVRGNIAGMCSFNDSTLFSIPLSLCMSFSWINIFFFVDQKDLYLDLIYLGKHICECLVTVYVGPT